MTGGTSGHPPADRFWPIAANLFSLIGIAFLISAWLLHYTDLFPEVLSLLSLGGLFAWFAFLANLLTEERKKDLQRRFEGFFLGRPRSLFWTSGVGALFFLLFASFRGTLVLETQREGKDRTIEVRSRGEDGKWSKVELDSEHLPPRSERKYLLPTSWFSSREYRVGVSGFPSQLVRVRAWRLVPVRVPADLGWSDRPAVLIRLAAELMANAQKVGGVLLVHRKGRLLGEINPYYGETVWVGCDGEVEIPLSMTHRWRTELSQDGDREAIVARWNLRRDLAPHVDLAVDDEIEIVYTSRYGQRLAASDRVKPPFPMEVRIDDAP